MGIACHAALSCRLYDRNIHNAMALENALLWLMIAAMLLRAAVYGALYFTLPRDRMRLKENKAPGRPGDSESDVAGLPACFANCSMPVIVEWF